MKIGDEVTYYTHEMSDDAHRVFDQLAWVVGIVDDKTIDVVSTGTKGPWVWLRASLFDPDNPALVPGLSYWRPLGSDPPDFAKAFVPLTPDQVDPDEASRLALADKQKAEIAKVDAKGYAAMRLRHAQEWTDLESSITGRAPPPVVTVQPGQPTGPVTVTSVQPPPASITPVVAEPNGDPGAPPSPTVGRRIIP